MKKPITKKRAREICRMAAGRLAPQEEFVCNTLQKLFDEGRCSAGEVRVLAELLWAVYAPGSRRRGVIWHRSEFGPPDETSIHDPRAEQASEARIIALLLLPEFL